MPKGGHARTGPPPDPMALARERPSDQASWSTLPAAGREGKPPRWPLLDCTVREDALWKELWARPQAVMWERLDQRFEVAMFVRMLARAEQPGSSIELQKVVRQYLDSLGLSVQGMLRNRWRIVGDTSETAAAGEQKQEPAPTRRPSARTRLKVVPHGEAGG